LLLATQRLPSQWGRPGPGAATFPGTDGVALGIVAAGTGHRAPAFRPAPCTVIIDLDTVPTDAPLAAVGGSSHPGRGRAVHVALAACGVAALVAVFYAASTHAVAGNSDGATVVLEGQSMGAGNVLLHHWALSLDSFWSVDAVVYMLAGLVTGVGTVLLHLVPAVIAAAVVLTGVILARIGHRGLPAAAAATTVVALLALPSHVLATYFLQGPLHVGTILWCLLAFAGLRSGRFGRGWVLAVVFLAAGALGDLQTAVIGMAPALGAGALAMLRTRDVRRGTSTAAAPFAALAVAGLVRLAAGAIGTFSVASSHPVATGTKILHNVGLAGTWGSDLLGVGGGRLGYGGVPTALELVHVVGVAGVVAGMVVALRRLVVGVAPRHPVPSEPEVCWRIDDLLLLAFVADLLVFVTLTYGDAQDFSRYLTGAIVFGAVLAGRAVARVATPPMTPRLRTGLAAAALGVLVAFGAGLGFTLTAAQPSHPYVQLGRFLETHHLERGLGDYWSASITTVSTGGAVDVRPVIADGDGHIGRYQRQSAATWYRGQRFRFLVYNAAVPWGGITPASAVFTFGPWTRTYDVGTFRVIVWAHPLSVSAGPGA